MFVQIVRCKYKILYYLNVSLSTALTYVSLEIFWALISPLSPRTFCVSSYSFCWASGFSARQYSVHKIALDVWKGKNNNLLLKPQSVLKIEKYSRRLSRAIEVKVIAESVVKNKQTNKTPNKWDCYFHTVQSCCSSPFPWSHFILPT